jgi:hypothetical protein
LLTPKIIFALFPRKYLFPILAFAIPFLIRAIPEILMGPYVVGFDTEGYYIPTILMWMRHGTILFNILASAPMFYTIVAGLASLGAPLLAVLKAAPIILHGFLGLSIYTYAKSGLSWSPKKSLLTALIGTVYFVAMRVSWDLLRNELALIFLFVVLTLLSKDEAEGTRSWKRYIALALSMMAVVVAHQLVSVIMMGMLTVFILLQLKKKRCVKAADLLLIALPAILYFAIVYFSPAVGANSIDFTTNFGWPLTDFVSYPQMLLDQARFFFYCYLPLLPLAFLSWRTFKNLQMQTWLGVTFILLLIPIVSLSNFRWVMMFTYPLAFYAADSLSMLKRFSWRRFRLTARRIGVIYLIASVGFLSLAFMVQSPEAPFSYFRADELNPFFYQIPSSMLQNTLSVNDCQDTVNVLQWFNINTEANAVLLSHRAFYGWALTTVNENQVDLYEFGNPMEAAQKATLATHNPVYLIWWTPGVGWYGLPTVSLSFQEVYHSGRIALYHYSIDSS